MVSDQKLDGFDFEIDFVYDLDRELYRLKVFLDVDLDFVDDYLAVPEGMDKLEAVLKWSDVFVYCNPFVKHITHDRRPNGRRGSRSPFFEVNGRLETANFFIPHGKEDLQLEVLYHYLNEPLYKIM